MKKVLLAISVILISINNCYCDELDFVSQSDSIPSIYNNTINIQAIIDSLGAYGRDKVCFFNEEERDKFVKKLAINFQNGINPTVQTVYEACLIIDDTPGSFYDIDACIDCVKAIVERHNLLLLDKPLTFKTEDDYTKAVHARGFCSERTVIDAPTSAAFKFECEKDCKRMAIQNACVLKGYMHGTISSSVECNCFWDYSHLDFVPTWKDYKKLYNIK